MKLCSFSQDKWYMCGLQMHLQKLPTKRNDWGREAHYLAMLVDDNLCFAVCNVKCITASLINLCLRLFQKLYSRSFLSTCRTHYFTKFSIRCSFTKYIFLWTLKSFKSCKMYFLRLDQDKVLILSLHALYI